MNDIAIIILNYNDYQTTIKCVDNLKEIKVQADLIVVDNNSENESFTILRKQFMEYENVSVIKSEKNGGYSYGNNYGIKYAIMKNSSVKYIAIMNPDVILYSADIVENLKRILSENIQIAAATGVMEQNGVRDYQFSGWKLPTIWRILLSDLLFARKVLAKVESKDRFNILDEKCYVDVLHGSFFLIKRDVFEKIGFFDDKVFMYYEENILGFKIKNMHMKMVVDLECHYLHNHKYHEMNLRQLKESALRRRKSQQFYLKQYLNTGIFVRKFIYYVYGFFIYIELPFIKCIGKLRKR